MRISINLGTNHCWVKEILNCSNKGSVPLQRGDNYENIKMGWGLLKPQSQKISDLHESFLM